MNIEFSYFDPAKVYTGRKQFDCEHAVINKFAHDSLVPQIKKNLSVAYVLTDSDKNDRFIGFFTMAHHAIDSSLLSPLQLVSLPSELPLYNDCEKVVNDSELRYHSSVNAKHRKILTAIFARPTAASIDFQINSFQIDSSNLLILNTSF